MRFWPGCNCCGSTPPVLVNCTSGGGLPANTVIVNRGGTTNTDDLYIGWIVYDASAGRTLTIIPTGWVALEHVTMPAATLNSGKTYKVWVGYRKPDPTEASSWTWTFSTPGINTATVTYVSGADIPSASSSNTGITSPMTAPSVACGDETLGLDGLLYDPLRGISLSETDNVLSCSAAFPSEIGLQTWSYSPSSPSTGVRTFTQAGGPATGERNWATINMVIDPF